MTPFETKIQEDLHRYLIMTGKADERLATSPDIEDKWESIAQAYLPDGIREYNGYPNVSLGWMMYLGMAMARLWEDDWQRYSAIPDLYEQIRDKRGYDAMDEYIREELLSLSGTEYTKTEDLVAECAARTNSKLIHEGFEPGTPAAFQAYLSCLHQLYLMGAAVQLKQMGYKMEQI